MGYGIRNTVTWEGDNSVGGTGLQGNADGGAKMKRGTKLEFSPLCVVFIFTFSISLGFSHPPVVLRDSQVLAYLIYIWRALKYSVRDIPIC